MPLNALLWIYAVTAIQPKSTYNSHHPQTPTPTSPRSIYIYVHRHPHTPTPTLYLRLEVEMTNVHEMFQCKEETLIRIEQLLLALLQPNTGHLKEGTKD